MNIIEKLLTEAQAMTPTERFQQWAFCDIDGERLAVTITDHKGGDGQVKKIGKRIVWHYKGKQIKIEKLKEELSK